MLGPDAVIHAGADVRASRLGRYTEIGERTKVVESTMDDYSYVASDSDIVFTHIGKFCSIAAHVRINPGNHPMERASQSHFTYRAARYFEGESDETSFFDRRRAASVHIGHDVWIGHGAIVLPGRRIGVGAVIAGGAVVTKDVADYAIVAGNPARLVRRRFGESVAARLMALCWWDWPHEALRRALPDFRSLGVEAFLEKYENASA
jgi:hypothetical protein